MCKRGPELTGRAREKDGRIKSWTRSRYPLHAVYSMRHHAYVYVLDLFLLYSCRCRLGCYLRFFLVFFSSFFHLPFCRHFTCHPSPFFSRGFLPQLLAPIHPSTQPLRALTTYSGSLHTYIRTRTLHLYSLVHALPISCSFSSLAA